MTVAVVDEQVVQREVAVHDLRAQGGPGRRDPLLEAVERGLHQAAGAGSSMWRASSAGPVALLDVPEQPAPGAGWKNPRSARAVRAATAPYAATVPGVEVRPDQSRLARAAGRSAEEVGRSRLRVLHDAVAGAAAVDGERRAERQGGVRGDGPERGGLLEVDVGRRLGLVGELDHQLPVVVAEEDDLVALAVQAREDPPADAVRRRRRARRSPRRRTAGAALVRTASPERRVTLRRSRRLASSAPGRLRSAR